MSAALISVIGKSQHLEVTCYLRLSFLIKKLSKFLASVVFEGA